MIRYWVEEELCSIGLGFVEHFVSSLNEFIRATIEHELRLLIT
jgi:hypothetical protein